MSAAQHTPGPWVAEKPQPHGTVVRAVATVAWCGTAVAVSAGGDGQMIDADEAHANARLIAVAPDLLDIAQRIEAMLTRQRWQPGDFEPEGQLLRDARAAIARAAGGEP